MSRTPALCKRRRTARLLGLAQEAESYRDGLDSFIVAGEGRRVGGLFYFTSLQGKRDRCVVASTVAPLTPSVSAGTRTTRCHFGSVLECREAIGI